MVAGRAMVRKLAVRIVRWHGTAVRSADLPHTGDARHPPARHLRAGGTTVVWSKTDRQQSWCGNISALTFLSEQSWHSEGWFPPTACIASDQKGCGDRQPIASGRISTHTIGFVPSLVNVSVSAPSQIISFLPCWRVQIFENAIADRSVLSATNLDFKCLVYDLISFKDCNILSDPMWCERFGGNDPKSAFLQH